MISRPLPPPEDSSNEYYQSAEFLANSVPSKADPAETDAKLGIEALPVIRLNKEDVDALREEAAKQGIILQAHVRNLLLCRNRM